jgi:hypothetical protein
MSTVPPLIGYLFRCKNCDAPIMLQAETLGRPFEPQAIRSANLTSVGVSCPHCRRIKNYSLVESSPDFDPTGKGVVLVQPVKTDFLGWFQCEEQSCGTPTLLVSPVTATMTTEQRTADIETWIWNDFRCTAGHRIQKPKCMVPLRCSIPGCGRFTHYSLGNIVVGAKIQCSWCGNTVVLSEEDPLRIRRRLVADSEL